MHFVELKNLPDAHWMWMRYHTAAALSLSACNFSFWHKQWHAIDTMCVCVYLFDVRYSPKIALLPLIEFGFQQRQTNGRWRERKYSFFGPKRWKKVTMTISATTCWFVCFRMASIWVWNAFANVYSVYWKMLWTKNENIFFLPIVRNGNGVVCFRNGNSVLFGHSIDLSQCQRLSPKECILVLNGKRQLLLVSLEFASNQWKRLNRLVITFEVMKTYPLGSYQSMRHLLAIYFHKTKKQKLQWIAL